MVQHIYSGSNDGSLYKLDPDKNIIWEFTGFSTNIFNVTPDPNGYVYACAGDAYNTVRKIDPSGNQVWNMSNVGGQGHEGFVWGIAVDSDGYVYSGCFDGELIKTDPNGDIVWRKDFVDRIYGVSLDIDGNIYIGTGDNDVFKLDDNGDEIWSDTPWGGAGDAVVDVKPDLDGNVYATRRDDSVTKYTSDGSEEWSITPFDNDARNMSIDDNGDIYVASYDDKAKKIDPQGNTIWTFSHTEPIYKAAIAPDGNCYLGSRDVTQLIKVDSNGNEVWRFQEHTDVVQAVGADPGRIGVGFWDEVAVVDINISLTKETISTNEYSPNIITTDSTIKNLVYQQRHETAADYDTALIDFFENQGINVTVIVEDISSHDFSNEDLLVVGAPGTDFTENPSDNFIANLDLPVLSFCRHTSRNTLDMSDASRTGTIEQFEVVDETHPIMIDLGWNNGESYLVGYPTSSHVISDLTSDTNLIMNNYAGVDRAGLAERIVDGHSKMHFGYHRYDFAYVEGEPLLYATLDYLGAIPADTGTHVNIPLSKQIITTNTYNPNIEKTKSVSISFNKQYFYLQKYNLTVSTTKNIYLTLPKQNISVNEYNVNLSAVKYTIMTLSKQTISTNTYNPSVFSVSPNVTVYLSKQNITTNLYNPNVYSIEPNARITLLKQNIATSIYNPGIVASQPNVIISFNKHDVFVYTKNIELILIIRGRLIFRGKSWEQNPHDPLLASNLIARRKIWSQSPHNAIL